jgi:hypothetical protein
VIVPCTVFIFSLLQAFLALALAMAMIPMNGDDGRRRRSEGARPPAPPECCRCQIGVPAIPTRSWTVLHPALGLEFTQCSGHVNGLVTSRLIQRSPLLSFNVRPSQRRFRDFRRLPYEAYC